MKITKIEQDFIKLAKKGYTYKEMAVHYNASYDTICEIAKSLYKKLEVRSMRAMLAKIKRIEDNTPIFDIAKEEWENLYPNDDLAMMTQKERDFSWEHWLRAFQIAQKRFKGTAM